jgi:SulP family sulfate permease
MLRSTRRDALVLVLTAVVAVAVELGLAVAGVLALLHLARSATFTSSRLSDEGAGGGTAALADEHVLVYRIDGPLFFAVAQRFLEEFASVSDAQVVILRLTDVKGLDASAAQALGDIVDHLERRGITVLPKGVRPEHFRILEAAGSLDHLATEHHVFADLPPAVDHARQHVARTGSAGPTGTTGTA